MSKPLVSIICPTYNHESFIREALDGFVMQKTNFPFEIIVHDDASTDSTAQIVKEYEVEYPHLFNNIYQTVNQFSIEVMSVTKILLNAASGKYIACCEGDDYWTDPLKLQKQVDYLENNEDYVCVGGKVKILDTRNETHKLQYDDQYFDYSENQKIPEKAALHIVKLPFHTSTYLFVRNVLDFDLLESVFKYSISGDVLLLNVLNAKGSIYYINDEFGVQHHNSGGITTMAEYKGLNFLWNRVYMWEKISKFYNQKDLWILANDNKKYFKEIFTKKFLNVSLADQISFYRNTDILRQDLVIAILITLVQKGLLKLGLKR